MHGCQILCSLLCCQFLYPEPHDTDILSFQSHPYPMGKYLVHWEHLINNVPSVIYSLYLPCSGRSLPFEGEGHLQCVQLTMLEAFIGNLINYLSISEIIFLNVTSLNFVCV